MDSEFRIKPENFHPCIYIQPIFQVLCSIYVLMDDLKFK